MFHRKIYRLLPCLMKCSLTSGSDSFIHKFIRLYINSYQGNMHGDIFWETLSSSKERDCFHNDNTALHFSLVNSEAIFLFISNSP